MKEETGSFRDPAGKIFYHKNRVFRKLTEIGLKRFQYILKTEIFKKSIDNNFLINSRILNDKEKKELDLNINDLIIEHELVPYISYPYEWSFSQLKEAAIFHLDFNLFLLNLDSTLIDASAFNIQFIGSKPVFIDILSLKEYKEGEPWEGHKQFCENFLNPLLLKSKKGIKFNNWFKGNLEGIQTDELDKILSIIDKFSYNVFFHVYILNKLEQKQKLNKSLKPTKNKAFVSKKSLVLILKQIRKFILKLEDYKTNTIWDGYSKDNSYTIEEEQKKKGIVTNFIKKNNFNLVADIGCNDGEYSKIALQNGCQGVIGFDFDLNTIDQAFKIAKKNKIMFLPLFLDASNPSTNLGWNENERKSFNKRAKFDAIIALAFEHHLSIAKNIPLEQVVSWLISLSPNGLIEFVPKNDITIQKMIELKGDIFPNYSEKNFENFVSKESKILSKNKVSSSGRIIYEYQR